MISEHGLVPKSQLGSRRPFLAACFLLASRLNTPRSPDPLSASAAHSRRNDMASGFSVYATLLFAKKRWAGNEPVLAWRIRSSERFDKLIIADRRTPPTTTISPILHMMSCASIEDSLRPLASLKVCTVKLNRSTRGAGPEARPPKVFSLAPAGRTLDVSHLGISPEYSRATS